MQAALDRDVVSYLVTRGSTVNVPIHRGEMGDLAAFVSFMAPSGFPLLLASCRAYRSFALRCCGVCACERFRLDTSGWRTKIANHFLDSNLLRKSCRSEYGRQVSQAVEDVRKGVSYNKSRLTRGASHGFCSSLPYIRGCISILASILH